ncbi:MAG TPA: hypothetical protein VFN96_08835, partial [Gemmatimonadales bacterium]|nr:hypothetical protein [Gemmatimonadales bacterium]
VAAFDLSGDTLFAGAAVRASLALGRDPATPPAVGSVDRDDPRGVVRSTAPWPASVVSLEVERPGSNRYARLRVASEPDTGEPFAISDLLLFEAGETLPASLDSVAGRALGDLVLDRQKPVGLYWELYGATGETIAASVSVEPARKGLLGRLGQSLGVVSRMQPVRLEWSGPGPGTDFAARSIELNLGRLDPGRYTIIVEARDGSGRRAAARRPVVLAR